MDNSKSNDRFTNKIKVSAEGIISGVLILGAIIVAVTFSIIAATRPLTNLEAVLLQSFGLGTGILGSFIFGRQSAKKAAKEMIKPHASSAFRRSWSLFQSLSRLAQAIDMAKRDVTIKDDNQQAFKYLPVFEAIVNEQLSTADDALEDWRDIIPEDVEELETRIRTRQNIKGIENE